METNEPSTPQNAIVKPVRDYLTNGPIPPEDLALLEFVSTIYGMGFVNSWLSVHLILETVTLDGKPEWRKGSVAEFEEKFHDEYQSLISDLDKNSEFVWMAAEEEVKAGRLSPLSNEGETKEQLETYLAQGIKRLHQTFAVELLLDMWTKSNEKNER